MTFWQHVRRELWACVDLLLPPACLLCGHTLPSGAAASDLCPACHDGIPRPAPARCPLCAATFRTPVPSLHHCESCLRHPPPFDRVCAVGPYAGSLRDAVQRLKYRAQLPLERPLGALLAAALERDGLAAELIVPVPLHLARLRSRGYNQSLQLAREVGRHRGVPVAADLLRRTRDTAAQQGLSAADRRSNLRGAFEAAPAAAGRHLLLIDDVMTTGATVGECARVLRAAGAASVRVAVLGRA